MARKGSKNIAEIPEGILKELEAGSIETANLPEGLAIDYAKLLANVFPNMPKSLILKMENSSALGITKRVRLAGTLIYQYGGEDILPFLMSHKSDTIRSFGAILISELENKKILEKLELLKNLADDDHFGVREWSWLAIRHEIIENLSEVLSFLTQWSKSEKENIRRFASEATRPRGVWCSHIKELKENPEAGLQILENLKSDPSLYVRNSVGNWLNDAAKSQEDWVKSLCQRWLRESDTEETRYICKRASRSI